MVKITFTSFVLILLFATTLLLFSCKNDQRVIKYYYDNHDAGIAFILPEEPVIHLNAPTEEIVYKNNDFNLEVYITRIDTLAVKSHTPANTHPACQVQSDTTINGLLWKHCIVNATSPIHERLYRNTGIYTIDINYSYLLAGTSKVRMNRYLHTLRAYEE